MTTGLRQPGDFCWVNIMTPRLADDRAFFGALLGWTFNAMEFGHTILVGGRPVGAIFPDKTPVIGVMMKVESADAAGERVRALGGQAQPAFDVAGAGRMTVCHDPTGAEFDVWEPRAMHGTDGDSDAMGAPTWFELATTDTGLAETFYASLFGWKNEHARFKSGSASCWATYFAVGDPEDAQRRALALGGSMSNDGAMRSPGGAPFYMLGAGRRTNPTGTVSI